MLDFSAQSGLNAGSCPVREPSLHGTAALVIPALQVLIDLPLQVRILNPADSRLSMLYVLYALPLEFRVHHSSFCRAIKSTALPSCRQSCLEELPKQCLRQRQPFVRTCHAGGREIITPIFYGDQLAAITHFGPFRITADGDDRLPMVEEDRIETLKGIGLLLRAYLRELLETPRFEAETSEHYRAEIITRFMYQKMRESPTVSDLAEELCLSPSRTRHLVKEVTGLSFAELWDQCRLYRSKQLLVNSYYKISIIAAECGFYDTQYFYRFFKQHAGMTPSAYRRQAKGAESNVT